MPTWPGSRSARTTEAPVFPPRSSTLEALRALLDSYLDHLPDGLADFEKAKLGADRIDDLSFLWAGGLQRRVPVNSH